MDATFRAARKQGRAAIIPYFVAGYPSFRRLREFLWESSEAGVSLIELGLPFSDPVADGPTLQVAIHDALRNGVTVHKTLDFVRSLRKEGFVTPILGMTYANLLFAPGYAPAARSWAEAGLDGAIIPDVPVEESAGMKLALRAAGLATVSFASPGTGRGRLHAALRQRDSFLYLVAVYGTTGARAGIAPETRLLLSSARRARPGKRPPLCVGFGVSRPDHVSGLHRLGADGVILGSAIAQRIQAGRPLRPYLSSLVRAAR